MNSAHAMWYLTRSTGIVTLVLVTLSVLIGIISSLRAGGKRTPRFVVAGLHRNVSLLTVVFIAIHVTTTVLDGYAPITFLDSVVPFISSYRPIWLGLGAVASDLVLALVITSLIRVRIGLRTWRGIHWTAYACFPIAIVHSLGTGSDASRSWMLAVVIGSVALVAIATLVRLWQRTEISLQDARAGMTRHSERGIRALGTLLVVATPIALAAWALAGPLAPRWAARAGTPTRTAPAGTSLADLAARETALEAQQAREIARANAQVTSQLAAVRAAIAAANQASRAAASASSSGGGASSSGGTAVPAAGGTSVPTLAPVAVAPTPAPVAVSGGSG